MVFGDAREGLKQEAEDHEDAAQIGALHDLAGGFLFLIDQWEVREFYVELFMDAVCSHVPETTERFFGEDERSDEGNCIGGEAEQKTVGD